MLSHYKTKVNRFGMECSCRRANEVSLPSEEVSGVSLAQNRLCGGYARARYRQTEQLFCAWQSALRQIDVALTEMAGYCRASI